MLCACYASRTCHTCLLNLRGIQTGGMSVVHDCNDTAMLKDLARRAFQARNYTDAFQLYLEAFKQAAPPTTQEQQHQQQQDTDASEWAVLASNIAAVLIKLDKPQEALEYAQAAAQAAPGWPKALYRQAAALTALQQHGQAVQLLQQLLQLIPANTAEAVDVAVKLQDAQAAAAAKTHQQQVQTQLMATHVAWANTRAREAAGRAALLEQLQQGMSGYAWEPSDWEWRPTWTPSMRHCRSGSSIDSTMTNPPTASTVAVGSQAGVGAMPSESFQVFTHADAHSQSLSSCSHTVSLLNSLTAATAGDGPEQQQQYLELLAAITRQLAELQGPKRSLALLADNPLLLWYKQGLAEAMNSRQPAAATVLVIANGGGGVLSMLAAAAGAARVVVIEKGRWGYRAAKQLLEGNKMLRPQLVHKIQLVPVPLSRCRLRDTEASSNNRNTGAAAADVYNLYHETGTATSGTAATAEGSDVLVPFAAADERCSQQQQQQGAGQAASDGGDEYFYLDTPADVVVTDLLDYSVLGQGVLPSLATAAASGLIAPGAIMLPHSLAVQGQLVNTHLACRVSGFSVGPVNKYKWHPTIEHVQAEQLAHFHFASKPLRLRALALADYAAQHMPKALAGSTPNCHSTLSHSSTASTQITADSDAVMVWFNMYTRAGFGISTRPTAAVTAAKCSASSCNTAKVGDSRADGTSNVRVDGDGGSMSSTSCFGLGLYYLDAPITAALQAPSAQQQQHGCDVIVTSTVQHDLRLSFSGTNCSSSSSNSITICYSWSQHGIPRHAMLPRWHFDMIADDTRNRAYDVAIRRAVAAAAAASTYDVHVLDVGTGTGLLAMMAARAGARKVTAVESVRHLAEAASMITALNGYHSSIQVVHKDGRYLTVGQQQVTAGQCDMERPADLLAFEVFDCGLIGEGALHIVASARANLLQPGAKILPAAAKVYCQPIQYSRQTAAALADVLDPSPLHAYAWQPEYFEADLRLLAGRNTTSAISGVTTPTGLIHNTTVTSVSTAAQAAVAPVLQVGKPHWLPLAPPLLAFEFDFNCSDPVAAFQPAVRQLQFAVEASGVCNAVAFWFEMQLDEQTCLSSSPYCCMQTGSSTTWKQAVQLLPEHRVCPGQTLTLCASHDTYAISFGIAPSADASCRTAAPSRADNQGINAGDLATAPAVDPTLPSSSPVGAAVSRSDAVAAGAAKSTCLEEAAVAAAVPAAPQPTGVPYVDPMWKATYDSISQVQTNLVKALTQDPLEYKKLVNAALMIAMRPWSPSIRAVEDGQEDTTPPSRLANRVGSKCAKGIAHEKAGSGAQAQVARPERLEADPHHAAALLVRLMS